VSAAVYSMSVAEDPTTVMLTSNIMCAVR
jgi:hypothetical protein